LVEKLDFLAKILRWARGISVETSRWWALKSPSGTVLGRTFDWMRARGCAGLLWKPAKKFWCLGNYWRKPKVLSTTVYWKIATEFQPHCWRSNFRAIDSARGPGAISQSWEHTPIKNGLCVFPGYYFKND
jgi:hypothetical protein